MPSYNYLNKRIGKSSGNKIKNYAIKETYSNVNILNNIDPTTQFNTFCNPDVFETLTDCNGKVFRRYCKGKFKKPLPGYRKVANVVPCPIKLQEIYKDPHSKSMGKGVCYDNRIRAINNKNGKKNLDYSYDYASYLRKKCKSFKKNSNVFIIANDNNGNNIYRSDCHKEKEVTKGTMQADKKLAATDNSLIQVGMTIRITGGLGSSNSATIVGFNAGTKVLTLSPDITTNNTSQYVIHCCSYKEITRATMQGAGRLVATDSSKDNFYRNMLITIVAGTGAGNSAMITGYVGNTRTVTLVPTITTDATSQYVIRVKACNLVSYKPKNKEFMTNGAVSSSNRLGRVKYDAITRSNCVDANGKCLPYSSFYRGGLFTPVNGNARFPNNGFECGSQGNNCGGTRITNQGSSYEKRSSWKSKRIRIGGVMRKAR